MQTGERQLHLRLNACRVGNPATRRLSGEVLQERRLANPWLAMHHQRAALAYAYGFEQPVKYFALGAAVRQLRRLPPRRPACAPGHRTTLSPVAGLAATASHWRMRAPLEQPHARSRVADRAIGLQSRSIGEPTGWRCVMTGAFSNRKLVVVGGSSGIGRQTALDVVADGGSAVIIGLKPDRVDDTVRALGATGKAWGIVADLTDREQVVQVQEQLAAEHADATLLITQPACSLRCRSSTTTGQPTTPTTTSTGRSSF